MISTYRYWFISIIICVIFFVCNMYASLPQTVMEIKGNICNQQGKKIVNEDVLYCSLCEIEACGIQLSDFKCLMKTESLSPL